MIVVCGGIKGGTGKTTLATNLTVMRATCKKVLLVDADEQQSASDWSEMRSLELPISFTTVSIFGDNVHKQVSKLMKDYDDIIIDVGGRDTRSQRSALTIADVFLIPFKPRSLDIWTISKVKSLISEIETVNPLLRSIFVINQADARGTDNKDAFKILKSTHHTCLEVTIGNRKCFANAASEGKGIVELKKKDDSLDEMMQLHNLIWD